VAVGDLMLSGAVEKRFPGGAGADALFAGVREALRSGDVVFGNLETPLCAPAPDRPLFRGDPAMAAAIAGAGFNLLSLANNHILEFGPGPLLESIEHVERHGIRVLGAGATREIAGRPVVMERRGVRIGCLGYGRTLQEQKDPTIPGFIEWDEAAAVEAVAALRKRVDCVVVSVHMGFMWIDYPNPVFKQSADRLLSAGAHVVLMHHAHVLQGYAADDGRVAVYNLGNFIADIWEGETGVTPVPDRQRESAIYMIDLDRRGVAGIGIVPIVMTDDLRVVEADEFRGKAIADRLERISTEIRSGAYLKEYARQRAELNTGNILVWLILHVKKGNWGELGRNLVRVRPEHAAMLGRFLWNRIKGLWRRERPVPDTDAS